MNNHMTAFLDFWDVIEKFKQRCRDRDWKTREYEDLVNAEGKYHYFVWTRHVHPDTFKRVVTNPYQAMRVGNSYKMVEVAFLAWVSQDHISEDILEILFENPGLLRKVALYDISQIYEGQSVCLKMNETKSPVFQEFERFLEEHGASFRLMQRVKQVSH